MTEHPLARLLRALGEHPIALASVLLAPIVFLLPPLPIDETRYLAVAWEMRTTGEFLVPHLNGALYAQKPPLMFWLINAGWLATGVHAWTARAVTLVCSIATLALLARLARRLSASAEAERLSVLILAGMVYFATFANAIMFDVLLTTCVLVALHGILDLTEDRTPRGILLAGLGIGLGILSKGPVMLLDIGFAAVLAPWWHRGLPRGGARYSAVLAASIALGAAIALAWAVPAALHGGPKYSHAIFLSQTLDRIEGTKTGTHAQPFWWYLVFLPVMVLPWPLALRSGARRLGDLLDVPAVRLAIAWVVPTVVVFSLIGGKQAHYLLPLLPGIALGLGVALASGALRVRVGLLAIVMIALGVLFAWFPHYAASRADLAFVEDTWPWWGVGVAIAGVVLLAARKWFERAVVVAVVTLVVVFVFKLALIQGPGARYDVRAVAAEVRAAQLRGQPIAHLGWHHGVYEFAGRLTEPLPVIGLAQLKGWAAEHPDGLVISFYRRYRFRAEPIFSRPFRGVEVSIWNAKDALASGVDPNAEHLREEGDDASDDD